MVKAQLQVLKAATKAEHYTHDYRQDFLDELIQVAKSKGDSDKTRQSGPFRKQNSCLGFGNMLLEYTATVSGKH